MSAKQALPLRLGIIGLSASAKTSWASNAHLPGLLNDHGKRDFTIAALCNSSEEAARQAIQDYKLANNVKAYGSPEELANDKDVDIVICSVRVDKHYETILPSVKAGKTVYVEWPIAANGQEVESLVQAAKQSGAKVAVGIQGRWVPPVAKIREIIESGRLGKVLSSNASAYGGVFNRDKLPEGLKYFSDKKIGGNPITIGFGHMLDFTLSAIGDFVKGTTVARTQIQWKKNQIFNPQTNEVIETVATDVPDLITVHGRLQSKKAYVVDDAIASVRFQRGPPLKDEPALLWHINCEKGIIRLKSMTSVTIQASGYDIPPEVEIHHFSDGSIEQVSWEWSSEQLEVAVPARGVMHCLYALAEGKPEQEGWVSLEDAANRAEQIESWLKNGKW